MRFSKFTDYGLRVCLYLGAHPDRLVPVSEIARCYQLSHGNLLKVVQQLVEGGFLESTRGRAGGVRLARPAREIGVGDVARLLEGDDGLVDCSSCSLRTGCGLIPGLAKAKAALYASLNESTLEDALLQNPRTLPLLTDSHLAARV